jgi:hypothetical protein
VLRDSGVETYDASLNQTFQMCAALLWTISDFPGYAMLSGWCTKGKLACPCWNYNINSMQLDTSKNVCYMSHCISNATNFNGSIEDRPPPELLKWEQISEKLKNINNVFVSICHNLDVTHIEKTFFII